MKTLTTKQLIEAALKRNKYLENRGSIMYAAFKKAING
jgi:hypothetical protein